MGFEGGDMGDMGDQNQTSPGFGFPEVVSGNSGVLENTGK